MQISIQGLGLPIFPKDKGGPVVDLFTSSVALKVGELQFRYVQLSIGPFAIMSS